MDQNQNKNNLANFSDINDEIIFKEEDGDFKLLSHGNLKDFDFNNWKEKSLPNEPSIKSQDRDLLDTGLEEKVLAPPPPMVWDKKSNFYFDTEDEDEVMIEREKLKKIEPKVKKYSLSKISGKLIQKYQINLVPQLEYSFSRIILSYLKHSREKIDTIESLKNLFKRADLKLDDIGLGELIVMLTEVREKIEAVSGLVWDDLPFLKEKEDSKKEIVFPKISNQLSNLDPRQKIKIKSDNSDIPFIQRSFVQKSQKDSSRRKMSDIKTKEKVISPIEELSQVSITVFRRLSNNPVEAAQKIINKISSFERESYMRKAKAIQNWRQSEVYKMYISLGRGSMESGISIEKIIEQKILANEKVLSIDEFKAISDLNKKIKF
ncbi:hypothetical protein K8R66_01635 [bacterium]|nr:hypothetical protein [bacterium]